MKYIFVDPSGSFNEGKGHTGIACISDMNWDTLTIESVSASHYSSRHEYWKAIASSIISKITLDTHVIIESFMIRNVGYVIGKMPETIQLIGYLSFILEELNIPYTFQTPSQAKSRFKDTMLPTFIPNLTYKNNRYYLNNKIINDHVRDALKHLLYFNTYKKGK